MSIKSTSMGAAALLAAAVFAGPALADGLPGRGRVADAPMPRSCTTAGNVGLTTDYVFRGISQNFEDPAVQGGVDFTCGRFYLGVWGSSSAAADNSTEVDIYGGFKTTTGPINWDLGFIYYAYPGASGFIDADFFEFKVGASGDVWKGGTLGGTVFYSPDGQYAAGSVWTFEGTLSQALPKFSIFTPTLGATVGRVSFQDDSHNFGPTTDYTYWNVGLTLGFLEKWSLDVRYWDTDLSDGDCAGLAGSDKICDSRVVGTVKYTF